MKKTVKKFCAALMTAALAASMLAGCGDEGEPSGNGGSVQGESGGYRT